MKCCFNHRENDEGTAYLTSTVIQGKFSYYKKGLPAYLAIKIIQHFIRQKKINLYHYSAMCLPVGSHLLYPQLACLEFH